MEVYGLQSTAVMTQKMDITVIILTYNEEKHIDRCIHSISDTAKEIFIVDSFSSDQTVEIAKSLGASVWQREFVNHAEQFNWALDNLPIQTEWVMRLDADEYLEPQLVAEIKQVLPQLSDDVHGVYLKRKVLFMGKWIRFGGFYPHILLRIWRRGRARSEQRWMDEHIMVQPGSKTINLRQNMVDDNHKGITFWINKHNSYATREMVEMLNEKYSLLPHDDSIYHIETSQAKTKRVLKSRYYAHIPLGLRSFIYFIYRYILRFGFLDGARGFVWHFLQGFWYRLLVDIKIAEVENRCQGDVELLKQVLEEEYGISL